MKTIKEASKLSGASVRTLQYYDNINLLSPSDRTKSSYRLYSDEDITKLKQILFLKELGFSLREIRYIINHPTLDQGLIFHQQKELLRAKSQKTHHIIKVLERLENGATLDDCQEDINSISQESKHMKHHSKLLLLFIPLSLAVGAFGIYQYLQVRSSDNQTPAASPSPIADVIHINPVTSDAATNCLDIHIKQINLASLPAESPTPNQIAFPSDLQSNLEIQALYSRPDLNSHEYSQLVNYVISKSDDAARYVEINFSADHQPIREMYAPDGEPSTINGHTVLIGHYTGQIYNEQSKDLEPIEKYYIDFTASGLIYSVETQGLSEAEVIQLIKSLL